MDIKIPFPYTLLILLKKIRLLENNVFEFNFPLDRAIEIWIHCWIKLYKEPEQKIPRILSLYPEEEITGEHISFHSDLPEQRSMSHGMFNVTYSKLLSIPPLILDRSNDPYSYVLANRVGGPENNFENTYATNVI